MAANDAFEIGCGCDRRWAILPAPNSDVFISDFGPLAGRILDATVSATSGAGAAGVLDGGGFPNPFSRPVFDRERSGLLGFFRIVDPCFLEIGQ
jgi:hypothetical protein